MFLENKMEKEKGIAICMRISTPGFIPISQDGLELECTECHEKIWMQDTTFKSAKANGQEIVPMCQHCGFKKMKSEESSIMEITPEQITEMRKKIGDFDVEALKKKIQILLNTPFKK